MMMAANKYHNSFVQSYNLLLNYTAIIRESQILIYYEGVNSFCTSIL